MTNNYELPERKLWLSIFISHSDDNKGAVQTNIVNKLHQLLISSAEFRMMAFDQVNQDFVYGAVCLRKQGNWPLASRYACLTTDRQLFQMWQARSQLGISAVLVVRVNVAVRLRHELISANITELFA